MKTLLVMRHAKSDWDAEFENDHERPLNRRGTEAARRMGLRLSELGLVPDALISSTAVRAMTTARLASESGRWGVEPIPESGFYGTGPDSVLEAVSRVRDADRLLIVGHQPTWGMLVHVLTEEVVEMKTAAVAVISLPLDSWATIPTASGRLETLQYP